MMTQTSAIPGSHPAINGLHTPLAADAPTLSRIVAGAWRMAEWQWTPQARLAWIQACLDLGVTTFDHADIYGDYQVEGLFGEALALAPGLRRQMQLVSKTDIALTSAARPAHRLKHYNTSAAHILAAVELSLAQLRTDHIDVLLLHRPSPLMVADEIAEAFTQLRDAGKVLAFGVSNFTPAQFALLHSRFPLVTNQVELSAMHLAPLHDGTLDQAQQLRIKPMIWSPLAGGRLFGAGEQAARVRGVLSRIAAERDVAMETAAYAWIMRHPTQPLPLTGSRKLDAIRAAVAACGWQMDEQDWFDVWQASTGHEVP